MNTVCMDVNERRPVDGTVDVRLDDGCSYAFLAQRLEGKGTFASLSAAISPIQ